MIDNEIIINGNVTLLEALKKMDELERRLLIICEGEKFLGVISIGDIQRAIINKIDLDDNVKNHIRQDVLLAYDRQNREEIKSIMKIKRVESMPIINENNELVDIIEWDDIFCNEKLPTQSVGCPVVIMAGGKGERLRPLTNMIPKPLIPVSDKTIIEEIIEKFLDVSCTEFYLSINYKGELIRDFFDRMKNRNYNIHYLNEDIPLGTGGSLWLLKSKVNTRFIVSNCDALIDVNLYDLIEYHKQNNNVATMVSVIKNVDVPYGVIETTENGMLKELKEKPDLVYQVNCGLYVFEPEALQYIKDNQFLNITDLLIRIKNAGKKVGVFPISEKSWRDMGNWTEYIKMIAENR